MPAQPETSLHVVGAGFGRTGTLSMKAALETLGLGPCHHMTEVFRDPDSGKRWLAAARAKRAGDPYPWASLLDGYRSVVDWPGCYFWRELADAFPEAPVLLTTREPERWYESAFETIYQVALRALASDDPAARERIVMPQEIIFQTTFQDRFEDRSFAIGVYEKHLDEVRLAIPAERLIEYRVGDGWEPLCGALGVDVPDRPFPHVNAREEFRAVLAAHT